MTIFGPDISSYQAGLDLSRLANASFVLAKTTEGTYYTDADYQGWRRQCAGLGKPFIWYHFLSGEDPHAQAAHTAAKVGDPNLPGMLDAEPAGTFRPSLAQMVAYADAAHAVGLNLRLVYLPHWYWQELGSPNLTALRTRGLSLVSSAYPGGSGSAPRLYPGDAASGWNSYGGMAPLLYQFTNQASDGGQLLDYNAFRGTIGQLLAALRPPGLTPAPSPTPLSDPEDDMPAFATGKIDPGAGVTTVVLPPPANAGAARWGDVWFSLGSDFGDAHVRITLFRNGAWTEFHEDFVVRAADGRVQPFEVPLPTDVEKISITRGANPNVSLSYLIEAVGR
ncbi:MAG: glycoside hydrolase family protein [Catenulispora phage 69_17]|jgi:lysozyme|nr:MAG: glycoside hydrolase family protein [Catenulispora phage 69_17]